jgi:hypothetical protein
MGKNSLMFWTGISMIEGKKSQTLAAAIPISFSIRWNPNKAKAKAERVSIMVPWTRGNQYYQNIFTHDKQYSLDYKLETSFSSAACVSNFVSLINPEISLK